MEKLQNFFQENPLLWGIIITISGIILSVYAIKANPAKLFHATANTSSKRSTILWFNEKTQYKLIKIMFLFLGIILVLTGILITILLLK